MQTGKNFAITLQDRLASYHNAGVVARYARQHKVSHSEAVRLFTEMKRFLYGSAVTSEPRRPSAQVDEMWHTFILFTKDYAEFCNDVLGKFVHHVPDATEAPDRAQGDLWMGFPSHVPSGSLVPLLAAGCTSDQRGSQENGGGSCSSLGG